jgi:hypothetical protein
VDFLHGCYCDYAAYEYSDGVAEAEARWKVESAYQRRRFLRIDWIEILTSIVFGGMNLQVSYISNSALYPHAS